MRLWPKEDLEGLPGLGEGGLTEIRPSQIGECFKASC